MRNLILALACLSISTSAGAATPKKLTLKEALEKGMAYSPTYQQQQSRVREIAASYSKAESAIYPTINGVASSTSIKNPGSFEGNAFNPGGHTEQFKAGVTVSQPLYSGGALLAGLAAAKIIEESTEQRLYDAKQLAASEIILSYLAADEAKEQVSLSQANVSILKSYMEITAKYAAIGRSKGIDRLQSRASYDLGQSEVLQTQNNYENALGELRRLIGIELNDDVDLVTKISLQPVEMGTLQQILEKALKNNPIVKALELDVKQSRETADVRMAAHKPKLSLDGTWGYQSPDRPNWFKEYSQYYTVGLNLTIPIFSGLSSFADRKINAETTYRAERDLIIYRDRLRQGLSTAMDNIKRNFDRLKLAQSAAESARKAMDSAMRDYRQGLLSSTDVLAAQKQRFEAEKQFSAAQYAYHRQVIGLRRDLGIDLEKTYENVSAQ